MKTTSCVARLGVVGLMFAYNPIFVYSQDFIGSPSSVKLLLPATAIASGRVINFSFSPQSTYLFYSRILPSDELKLLKKDNSNLPTKLYTYTLKGGVTREIQLDNPRGTLQVIPMGDDATIFFADEGRKGYQGFYNLATKKIVFTTIALENTLYFGEQPGFNWLLTRISPESVMMTFFDGRQVPLGLGNDIQYLERKKQDATNIYMYGYKVGDFSVKYEVTIRKSDFAVSKKILPKGPLSFDALMPDPQYSVDVRGDKVTLTDSNALQVKGNVLPPFVDLCLKRSFESSGMLSSDERFVAYLDGGSLLMRELVPSDPKLAMDAARSREKAKAIQDAKMVGTGIMIYTADWDDVLPSADDFNSKIEPYLKNRDLLDGFTYTGKAENLANLKDPAGTEIGFKSGPGGRAIVYADGHVVWKDDK